MFLGEDMPKKTIKLTGLNAIIASVLLLAVLVIRVATIGQNTDEELLKALDVQLMSEFYPNQVARMKAALKQADLEAIEADAGSILEAKVSILAVQTSYPVMDFSYPKIVIVKVRYDLDDRSGDKIKYYRFKEGIAGSQWLYQYEANVISFYLNFL